MGNQAYRTLAQSGDRLKAPPAEGPAATGPAAGNIPAGVKLPPLSPQMRDQMVADVDGIVRILKFSTLESADQITLLETIKKYARLDEELRSGGVSRGTSNFDHFLRLLKSRAFSRSSVWSLWQDQYAIAYDALWYRLRGFWLKEFKRLVNQSQTQKTSGPEDKDVENGVALIAKQEAMGMWGMLKGMGTALVGIAGPKVAQAMAEQFDETAQILFGQEWDASEPLVWGMNAGQIGTVGGDVIWQLVTFARAAGPGKAGKIMVIADKLKKIMGIGAGLQGVAMGATGIARVIEEKQKAGVEITAEILFNDPDFLDQLVVLTSSAIGAIMAGKAAPVTKADAVTRESIQLLLSGLNISSSLARLAHIAASDKSPQEKELEYGQVLTSLIPQLLSLGMDVHARAQAKHMPEPAAPGKQAVGGAGAGVTQPADPGAPEPKTPAIPGAPENPSVAEAVQSGGEQVASKPATEPSVARANPLPEAQAEEGGVSRRSMSGAGEPPEKAGAPVAKQLAAEADTVAVPAAPQAAPEPIPTPEPAKPFAPPSAAGTKRPGDVVPFDPTREPRGPNPAEKLAKDRPPTDINEFAKRRQQTKPPTEPNVQAKPEVVEEPLKMASGDTRTPVGQGRKPLSAAPDETPVAMSGAPKTGPKAPPSAASPKPEAQESVPQNPERSEASGEPARSGAGKKAAVPPGVSEMPRLADVVTPPRQIDMGPADLSLPSPGAPVEKKTIGKGQKRKGPAEAPRAPVEKTIRRRPRQERTESAEAKAEASRPPTDINKPAKKRRQTKPQGSSQLVSSPPAKQPLKNASQGKIELPAFASKRQHDRLAKVVDTASQLAGSPNHYDLSVYLKTAKTPAELNTMILAFERSVQNKLEISITLAKTEARNGPIAGTDAVGSTTKPRTSAVSHERALGAAMERERGGVPLGHDRHHVAMKSGGGLVGDRIRDLLRIASVPIDHEANGIPLRGNPRDPRVVHESDTQHWNVHTKRNQEALLRDLENVRGDTEATLDVLRKHGLRLIEDRKLEDDGFRLGPDFDPEEDLD